MRDGSDRETSGLLFSSFATLAGFLLVAWLTPAADPLAAAFPGALRAAVHLSTGAAPSPVPVDLEHALSSVHRLRTRTTYEVDGEPAHSEVEGTGFVVEMDGRLWVASLAHAVSDEPYADSAPELRSAAAWRSRSRLISQRTWIDLPDGSVELRPLLRDAASDLAFFEAPAGASLRPLPLPAAEAGALHVGDPVFLLGRLEGADLHVRSGIVSATAPTAKVAVLPGARDAFMISAPLSHGDSGAPVLAQRAGRLELAGIAQGKYATAREAGWVIRIGPALAALRRAAGGATFAAGGR
jgi:S1-C subfamily serine protease